MEARKTVVCKGLFGEAVEVPVNELRFRPSVHGILIQDSAVLLCPQWDGWDYPGGGIDLGETLDEALVREVKEETGITIRKERLLHVSDNFFQPTFTKEQHWHGIKIYYACSYVGGSITADGLMEHEKEYMKIAEWIPVGKIAELKFYNQVDNGWLIDLAMKAAAV